MVSHLRFFTALRWDIAPGFCREPRIWAVLVNTVCREEERLTALGDDAMEAALQAAIASANADHWDDTPESLAR